MSISRIRIGAIFVGWITSLFVLFSIAIGTLVTLVTLGVDIMTLPQKISGTAVLYTNFLIVLAFFATFFIGGYVAGRMSAYAGALNGAMVVVTSVLAVALGIVFVVTFTNKLGIGIANPLFKTLSSLAMGIFVVTAFAFMGSILGGKFGEGYVDRLDIALGITKPKSTTMQITYPTKTDKDTASLPPKTTQKSGQVQAKEETKKNKKAS